MTLVVDASALLDTLDTDRPEWSEQYLDLTREHDVIAPALLNWEAGNVMLGRLAHRYGRSPHERAERLETLLEGIDLQPPSPESRMMTAAMAHAHGLTFYDAAYLELAVRTPVELFVTHDEALRKAAKKELRGRARVRRLDKA